MPPTMPLSAFRRQPDAAAADAWFAGRAGQAILASEAESLRVALDQEMAGFDAPLAGVREVAFFPPMTGG